MSQNFLQLNSGKTELMIIGSKRDREKFEDVSLWLDGFAIPQSASVRNLGVLFDPQLCFDQHIRSITRIAFFHLRNIARIRSMLSVVDAETLIHAFVSSRLDYCNALFSGLPNLWKHICSKIQMAMQFAICNSISNYVMQLTMHYAIS